MNIECPSCSTENKIEFAENVICSECKKSFSGYTYKKFKKPLLSAASALFIGAFGGYHVEQWFLEDSRYPTKIEYELIDSCVNSSGLAMNSLRVKEKKTICTCALVKTMRDIAYNDIKGNETKFSSRFLASVNECR